MGLFFVRLNGGGQSGNVVLALFGAVGLLGAVGYGYTSLIKGPAKGVSEITSRTASETDIFDAANILVAAARQNQAAEGDCDTDTYIEPLPWRAPAGAPAPTGGGLIPTGTPASTTDSWGTTFGYCAWDHGPTSVSDNNAGCGGSAALRKEGGDIRTEYSLAVISAGADRIFQTSCVNFVDANTDNQPDTPLMTKAAGSDDIFVRFTYAEAFDASGVSGGGLGDVEDDACTPDAIGLMRYEMEVVQVCLEDPSGGTVSWHEVGAEANATPGYTPTNNAALNTQYTSNAISFTGYFGTRLATVDNGGTIILNGSVIGASAQVAVGDTVAVRGMSANTNQETKIFNLKISSIVRPWALTTILKTAPVVSMAPTVANAHLRMTVDGISGETTGTSVTFTISQNAAPTSQDRAVVGTPSIAPATNFSVTGNTCATLPEPNKLALGGTCQITVTSKATATNPANSPFTATLTVPTAGELNGTVTNLTSPLAVDSLFPVTLVNATNVNISARAEFTAVPLNIAGTRWAANRAKRVIIPSGVTIGSNAVATPAMQSGTGWGGTLYVTVDAGGSIQGAGGAGGTGGTTPGAAGGVGGTAFLASAVGIQLVNNGTIYAGGGGGGQAGAGWGNGWGPYYHDGSNRIYVHQSDGIVDQYWYWGGAMVWSDVCGCNPSAYGNWQKGSCSAPVGGANWWEQSCAIRYYGPMAISGPAGGRGRGYDGALAAGGAATGGSGTGGTGGDWGVSGTNGTASAYGAGGAGGLAGFVIQNAGNVTLTGSGTTAGR